MSATPGVTPNVQDDEAIEQLTSSLLVASLILLSLLIAALVAIVVYLILVRGTNIHGYAPIRLVRADKADKKSDSHGKYKFYRKREKSDQWIDVSAAQLMLTYIGDLAKNKSRIDEDWKFDDDHQRPEYLVASDPQLGCANELWELVTRDRVSTIVTLSSGNSDGCYWPSQGSLQYGRFLVRLVSEHKHDTCFVIRSFVICTTKGGQFSSTVTQYHLLKWPHIGNSSSIKSMLDFRKKVNQSLSKPLFVHCTDGISHTGTYCLVDIVLNRMYQGVREIDVAATLEHLRDQKQGMVPTKELYKLAIAAIVEGTQDMFSNKL